MGQRRDGKAGQKTQVMIDKKEVEIPRTSDVCKSMEVKVQGDETGGGDQEEGAVNHKQRKGSRLQGDTDWVPSPSAVKRLGSEVPSFRLLRSMAKLRSKDVTSGTEVHSGVEVPTLELLRTKATTWAEQLVLPSGGEGPTLKQLRSRAVPVSPVTTRVGDAATTWTEQPVLPPGGEGPTLRTLRSRAIPRADSVSAPGVGTPVSPITIQADAAASDIVSKDTSKTQEVKTVKKRRRRKRGGRITMEDIKLA